MKQTPISECTIIRLCQNQKNKDLERPRKRCDQGIHNQKFVK